MRKTPLTPRRSLKSASLHLEHLEDRRLLVADFLPGDLTPDAAVNDQQFVAVERGNDGYLAVWMDERPVLSGFVNSTNPLNGNGQDIYGQLLDSTGRPTGDPIVIANTGHNQTKPALAWNASADAWLVAFDSQDPEWYFDEHVYGVRVSSSGSLLDSEPQLLFEQDGNQGFFDVDVASDGTSWAVISSRFYGNPVEGTVFGRRVAADGSFVELAPKVVMAGDVMMADIEYADGTYLIASKNRVTDHVFVTATDTSLTATTANISVGPGSFPGPQLASNGTEFLVVADQAFRINSNGQVLTPGGIAVGGNASVSIQRDATWNGSEWSVAFLTSSGDVGLQRIDATGSVIDTEPTIVDAAAMNERIAIAGHDGDSVVLFSDRPGFDQDIRGVHFAADLPTSESYNVSIGQSRQSNVVSTNGPANENLVVYVSQVSGETRILSQRVADDGSVLDAEPTVVAVESSTSLFIPAVGWNGTDYLVTWGVNAQRLSASNQPIGSRLTMTLPARTVAASGDTFVVGNYESYFDPISDETRYRIYYSRISSDGTLLDIAPVLIGGGSPANMSAAVMGNRVIMSYRSTQAVFIEADGTVSDPVSYSNSLAGSTSVAVNGDQALFVYTTASSDPNENSLMGRFVYADGTAPDWEFPIAAAPGRQLTPETAWIGDQYVVAWSDYRHLEPIQQQRADIRATRITANGVVREPNGFTVTNSAGPDDLPSVVGGGGNSWILYSALNGPSGAPEIQRIGYQFGPIIDRPLHEFRRSGIPGGFAAVSSSNVGVLIDAVESHEYEILVDPSESATAVITPANELATLTAGFIGHGQPVSASAAGETLTVPLTQLPAGGLLTLDISSDRATEYTFEVYRNENVESLVETAIPVAIDDSEFSLGRNSQYSAIGQSNGQLGGDGFAHYNDPGLFFDISTTGASLTLNEGFYGNRAFVTTTIGNDIFPAGTVTVARDGLIVAGFNDTYLGQNETLPDTFRLDGAPTLAPLWTLLGANNSSGLGNGQVLIEETNISGVDALVVQWHEVPIWHDFGAATFQIQVFASGPIKSRFVYQDITFGDPNLDGGGDASIGVQLDASTAYQFSYMQSLLSDGDVLDFSNLPTIEDVDEMTLDLVAGESIDVALRGVDGSVATSTLELFDPNGTLVGTGDSSYQGEVIENFDLGILGYDTTLDGTYTFRVTSTADAKYELLVTRDLALEIETSNPTLPRQVDLNTGAMGSLTGRPTLAGYEHYNDPTRFIDISQTGEPLIFDHGDGVTPIYSHVSNALMQGPKYLVASDGALMHDEEISTFNGSFTSPLPNNYFEFSALVPFWTDLEDSTGAVYYEERLVDGVNTLIVQWDNRSYFFQSGTGTFQVQLFDADPTAARQLAARFVYPDVDFNNAIYDNGADATIGVQLDPNSADAFSHLSPVLANGDVVDFYYESGDRFEVSLAAGEILTLHTLTPLDGVEVVPSNVLDPAIAILDDQNQVVTFDTNGFDGKNAGLEFTAPTTGDYEIVVYAERGFGEYVVQTTPGQSFNDGDFDNNGTYDVVDLDQLTRRVNEVSLDPVFDLNADGIVTVADVDSWLAEAGTNNLPSQTAYLPGDANLDGFVDGQDFIAWNANKFSESVNWSDGDFNVDGFVDAQDFIIWNQYKFQSASPAVFVDPENDDRETRNVERYFSWLKFTGSS